MPSTDIDDLFNSRKIVSLKDGGRLWARKAGHRVVEAFSRIRILAAVFKSTHTMLVHERRFVSTDAIENIAQRDRKPLFAGQECPPPHRPAHITAEKFGRRGESKQT